MDLRDYTIPCGMYGPHYKGLYVYMYERRWLTPMFFVSKGHIEDGEWMTQEELKQQEEI